MNKVQEIEFHFSRSEVDDCFLRAAELIKEGYTINKVDLSEAFQTHYLKEGPCIHVTLRRKFENE